VELPSIQRKSSRYNIRQLLLRYMHRQPADHLCKVSFCSISCVFIVAPGITSCFYCCLLVAFFAPCRSLPESLTSCSIALFLRLLLHGCSFCGWAAGKNKPMQQMQIRIAFRGDLETEWSQREISSYHSTCCKTGMGHKQPTRNAT
jgi:hypothetical protein